MLKIIKLICDPLEHLSENSSETIDKLPIFVEISLEEYIIRYSRYANTTLVNFFFNTMSFSRKESIFKNYVITYDDYKMLVNIAKQTKFGLLILTVGNQKIVFIANRSIQDKLVSLEGDLENKYTSRIIKTEKNHRLLGPAEKRGKKYIRCYLDYLFIAK